MSKRSAGYGDADRRLGAAGALCGFATSALGHCCES